MLQSVWHCNCTHYQLVKALYRFIESDVNEAVRGEGAQ